MTCEAPPSPAVLEVDAIHRPSPRDPAPSALEAAARDSRARASRAYVNEYSAGRRVGWRGGVLAPWMLTSGAAMRGFDRGAAMRGAARALGLWFPGCNVRVPRDVRRDARREAAAAVGRRAEGTPRALRRRRSAAVAAARAASGAPETSGAAPAPSCAVPAAPAA